MYSKIGFYFRKANIWKRLNWAISCTNCLVGLYRRSLEHKLYDVISRSSPLMCIITLPAWSWRAFKMLIDILFIDIIKMNLVTSYTLSNKMAANKVYLLYFWGTKLLNKTNLQIYWANSRGFGKKRGFKIINPAIKHVFVYGLLPFSCTF